MGRLKKANDTKFFKYAAERGESFWPKGIHCMVSWASGSLVNRLPAISYFPAVINYKFRYVKYFDMLNITPQKSSQIRGKMVCSLVNGFA